MEFKSLPMFLKGIEGRVVSGIFAVHGNVDAGGDVSENGSFAKRLNDGTRSRVRFLWNHNGYEPPIATIKEIREVGVGELPKSVLSYAPEATGGVLVVREYLKTERANEVFAGLTSDPPAITEMSYAYDIHGFEMKEMADGRFIRVLKDVELFDVSDVNWGMNPATAASKTGGLVAGLPVIEHSDLVASTLTEFVERVKGRIEFRQKEGRVLSTAIRGRISSLVEQLSMVSTDLKTLLDETEPKGDATQLYAEFQQILFQIGVKP